MDGGEGADFLTFPSSQEWDDWLARNHDVSPGLRIRFFHRGSKKEGLGRTEALEIALRYGWIDSVLKKRDEESYLLRFTPRKKGSHWSRGNLETVERLIAEGRMTDAGLRALGDLKERYESLRGEDAIDVEMDYLFRDEPETRAAFDSLPRSHRRTYGRYILSAKRSETRQRRKERVAPMIRERKTPIL
jgi:uncharacterized protein YdeI (YjbR/CyaY-like superfamily)